MSCQTPSAVTVDSEAPEPLDLFTEIARYLDCVEAIRRFGVNHVKESFQAGIKKHVVIRSPEWLSEDEEIGELIPPIDYSDRDPGDETS